jgi:cobalamin biosynthesis protein CobD/CbiB
LVDGSTNRFEGMKWGIVCGGVIFIVFYAGVSWVTKAIWITAMIASVFQLIVGLQQRRLSKTINRIFTLDIEKLPKEQNKN